MRDKIIYVNFAKNKRKNKNQTFFSLLKYTFKKLFSSTEKPSDSNDNKKIIYYNKDIS